jgi:hypothetical protein
MYDILTEGQPLLFPVCPLDEEDRSCTEVMVMHRTTKKSGSLHYLVDENSAVRK